MHPAQAGRSGLGAGRGGWLRWAQLVWIRRGSATPVVPGIGTVIMVIAARLSSSHCLPVLRDLRPIGDGVKDPAAGVAATVLAVSSQRSVLLTGSGVLRLRQAQ